jgi:hypothetical protein
MQAQHLDGGLEATFFWGSKGRQDDAGSYGMRLIPMGDPIMHERRLQPPGRAMNSPDLGASEPHKQGSSYLSTMTPSLKNLLEFTNTS